MLKHFSRMLLLSCVFTTIFSLPLWAQKQKLSPEEIIAKHLESIGKRDLVTASQRRMVMAGSEFLIRTNSAKANGRAVLASDGSDMAFFSTFNMRDYSMERIGVFSNKIEIPFVTPGRRSTLGAWLTAYDRTLNDRIFGGVIFSTWLFLRSQNEWGEMKTEGKKRIGDRDAWVISYSPKKPLTGSSSSIKLYFDAENFHHLRTVYRQGETESGFYDTGSRSNQGSVSDWGANMASNGSTLTEDFADYREDIGLMLPHKYTVVLNIDSASGTHEFRYDLNIEEYRLIREFPANFFSFDKSALAQ